MDPALRAAATGMAAQQTRVEVIANNLANVNTPGFKRSRRHFGGLLYRRAPGAAAVGAPAATTLPAIQVGRGTRLAAVQRIETQGPIEQTGRPLDLAIEGAGYFQVQLPNGTIAYTRDGSFMISDQGTLVTHGGYTVLPGIDIPPDAMSITISRNGVVTVEAAGQTEPIEIGRIELARFANAAGLLALGENLFAETPASGPAIIGYAQEDGFGRIIQGSLEASNVEIVQEMVDMIAALRAYEINSKAVKASEDMAEITNGMVR